MCIYYKDKLNLTYTGQEHIFPAAIGGVEKLPQGYVSDEANHYFSKLEQELLKSSMISLSREIFGPGKRGTDKLGEVKVSIMKDDNNEYCLGYIFKGNPYYIPSINVNLKNGKAILSLSKKEGSKYLQTFLQKLKDFSDRFVYIQNNEIPQDIILIGHYQNKYFIASAQDRFDAAKVKTIISAFIDSICENLQFKNNSSQVKVSNALTISKNNAKVYAKIAFNTLAKFKGKDYILDPVFDDMRKWIIGEKDLNINWLPNRNSSLNYIISEFTEHYCIITDIDGYICAEVSLYGWKQGFKLGKNPGDAFGEPLGFFCDSENRKEYTLIEKLKGFIHC